MMHQMKSRPQAVEAAISKVREILNRLAFKMINAKDKEQHDLFEARAKCAKSKLKALIALQKKNEAAAEFLDASAEAIVVTSDRMENACAEFRQAVCAHSDLTMPEIHIYS